MSERIIATVKGFQCLDGCSDCCGLIGFDLQLVQEQKAPEENIKLVKKVLTDEKNKIWFITKDRKCVFLDRKANKCTIYNYRPQVCKDFGMGDGLPCPYLKPTGEKRTDSDTKYIIGNYIKKQEEITNAQQFTTKMENARS